MVRSLTDEERKDLEKKAFQDGNKLSDSQTFNATSLPATRPPAGFDADDANDLIMPKAKLVQPTSEENKLGLTGKLINSLTKEELGHEFIPIHKMQKEWIRNNPRRTDDPNFNDKFKPGETIWRSFDKNDPRVVKESQFGPNKSAPLATAFLRFLSYFPGLPMPLILSFSKTSYGSGQQLLSMTAFKGGDKWDHKYTLSINEKSNGPNTYYVLNVKSGPPSDQDERDLCAQWKQQYAPKAIVTEPEPDEE